jgi:hypothetical protein
LCCVKKKELPYPDPQPFLRVKEGETSKGKPIPYNEYFHEHPEMMLGTMEHTGTMYRSDQPALEPRAGESIEEGMRQVIDLMPADVLDTTAARRCAAWITGRG